MPVTGTVPRWSGPSPTDLTSCLELKSIARIPLEKDRFLPAAFSYDVATSAQQESPKYTQRAEEIALVFIRFSVFTTSVSDMLPVFFQDLKKNVMVLGSPKQSRVVIKHLFTIL